MTREKWVPGIDYPAICTIWYCHDGEGHILLMKRSSGARDEHGRWDNGGGMLSNGMTAVDNLVREMAEELSTVPRKVDFLGYRDVFRNTSQGCASHWLALDYLCLVNRRLVRNAEPHKFDEIGWFALDDLPSPLHSQFNFALQKYRLRDMIKPTNAL